MLRARKIYIIGLLYAAACGGSEPSTTVADAERTVPMDAGVRESRTPDAATKMDATIMVDAADSQREDAGNDAGTSVLRTLADYRLCDDDEDCPVGLGSCIKTVPFNRAWPDGSDTATISALFDGVDSGRGVCSATCTNDPLTCSQLSLNGLTPDPKPHVCQLVALGPSPYPEVGTPAFPFDDQLDEAELILGQPFASICRPPFELDPGVDDGFGAECVDGTCPGSSVCYDLLRQGPVADGDAGTCLAPCPTGTCPLGFACSSLPGTEAVCVPSQGTYDDCKDIDADGRGAGRCGSDPEAPVTEVDCDDRNADAYFDAERPAHPFPMFCGAHDFNCNGRSDDAEQIGSADFGFAHCTFCNDTCTGTTAGFASRDCRVSSEFDGREVAPGTCRAACDDPTTRADCNLDIADGCEVEVTDPTRVFWLDLDRDGFGDPDFSVFSCSSTSTPEGYAPSLAGVDCNDDEASGATDFPEAPERCDGRDNNCNGAIDETPFVREGAACSIAELHGECARGEIACTNGAPTCMQVNFPTREVCGPRLDRVDEDCDGEVDELDDLCPNQVGACAGAVQVCGLVRANSRYDLTAGCEFPDLPFPIPDPPNAYATNNSSFGREICNDGIDNDCDGDTDCEDARCRSNPLCDDFCPTLGLSRDCPNQNGVCSGARQTCENRGGTTRWSACNYALHSTSYRSSEIGEFDCSDGLDNDCAGGADCDDSQCATTDWCQNYCPNNGDTRPCSLTEGACMGAEQTCVGNQWTACDEAYYLGNDINYRVDETASNCDGIDNDCDGTVDEGCPLEGEAGFSISTSRRYRLSVTYPNGDTADRFGGGWGPFYNLLCPGDMAVTKLHVYHNNHTDRNYNYRPAMRVIRVGITCGRPEVRLNNGVYEARMQRSEVRYPSNANRVSDSSALVPRGPTYPFSTSGDYIGTWGRGRDAWALFSDEFQHSTVDCGLNGVIRGAKVKADDWIDALGATCHNASIAPGAPEPLAFSAEVRTPEEFWGGVDSTSRETNAECPSGEVMVGLRVQMENNSSSTNGPNREWVSEIEFYCAPLELNTIP